MLNNTNDLIESINQHKICKHFTHSSTYYSIEAGFFAGLGFALLTQEDYRIKTKDEKEFAYSLFTQDTIYWYYKMSAHYGLLALKEIE